MRSNGIDERVLRAALGGIIASVSGVGIVGCGTTPVACGGCGCNSDAFASQTYNVTYTVCGDSDGGVDAGDGGVVDAGACFTSCSEACASGKPVSDPGFGSCLSQPDAGAASTVTASCETLMTCLGRKLDGLVAPHITAAAPLGAMFAEMAWLEAASIHAFRRLARELESHGAPRSLVGRARACARDEARHARLMGRLAKKHGASVPRVVVGDVGSRSIEEVARENAVEACVGETYGALVAEWQARQATDTDLGAAMREIAPDELRHAALGWDVAAWADTRLDASARERVRAARHAAAQALVASTKTAVETALTSALATRVLLLAA